MKPKPNNVERIVYKPNAEGLTDATGCVYPDANAHKIARAAIAALRPQLKQGNVDLMGVLYAWRHAEVHAAAITLGLRVGNRVEAETKSADATRALRVLVDSLGLKPTA